MSKNSLIKSGLLTTAALTLLLTGSQFFTDSCWASSNTPLAAGKAKLAQGQVKQAVQLLESAVKAAPSSCEAHLCLGQAYIKAKDFPKAKQQLRAAIRMGRGSSVAQKANSCLMSLPHDLIAPRHGPGTALIARATGVISLERGVEGSRPTVIDFYASWANPCKLLKPALEKARAEYGDRVNFLTVNVDDPNSDDIVEKYGVSPVPTLVFLKPDGEVATYSVGYSGDQSVSRGLVKILPAG